MLRFAISTLGCKVNSYESQYYIETLRNNGFIEVGFHELADIYIINTCTVTNIAASKSRQKIHQAKKNNSDALIVVIGCMVQVDDESLKSEGIDLMIGAFDKDQILDLIRLSLTREKPIKIVKALSSTVEFDEMRIKHFNDHTRAFLKIQDGCDQYCSYCIIPYARGKERSLAPDKVINQARDLITSGHKEIVLSGIHTGRYGKEHGYDLTRLIKDLLNLNIERIRISSIEITEVTDELIDLMKNDDRIARHLHIPLQSGSNKILELMKRPYDTKYYLDRINNIRFNLPDIAISTDVIVGFPQEDDNDHLDTLKFVNKLKFAFIHVFPYSKRENTLAAKLNGQVSGVLKKARVRSLIEISKSLSSTYRNRFIDKMVRVLVEDPIIGHISGYTSEYLPVKIKDNSLSRNEIYEVKITDYDGLALVGIIKEVIK